MKKTICAALCALLVVGCVGCAKVEQEEPVRDVADAPVESPAEEGTYVPDTPVYYDESSAEYRELYADNPIEEGLDEKFTEAVSMEDFTALSETYLAAWKTEYHALMAQLLTLYPDDADDLAGLRDYTDANAQAAYDETYAQHFYIDENGVEQPATAAVQNANFTAAEVYKKSTVLSLLNDYREAAPYVFAYAGAAE